MASHTRAVQTAAPVDGSSERRLFSFDADLDGPTPVDGSSERRLFSFDADAESIDPVDGGHDRRLATFGGYHERPAFGRGIMVPTGNFRRVDIRVVDDEGEPLPEVKWIMSGTIFPTAARVDDEGNATMWLLSVTYTSFMAVAETKKGTDLVWYSNVEDSAEINPAVQNSGTVVLEPVYIGGLNAAPGVSFGL